jgi:hypothetical protein
MRLSQSLLIVVFGFISLFIGSCNRMVTPYPKETPAYQIAEVRQELVDRSQQITGCETFIPVPEGHPPFTASELTAADVLLIDTTPEATLPYPGTVETPWEILFGGYIKYIPTALALNTDREPGVYTIHWHLYGKDRYAGQWRKFKEGQVNVHATPGRMSETKFMDILYKDEPSRFYVLYAWAEDASGNRIARNFWTHTTFGNWRKYPVQKYYEEAMASVSKTTRYYRWHPTAYIAYEGDLLPPPSGNTHWDVVSLPGKASITYCFHHRSGNPLTIPKGKRAYLLLEIASCPAPGQTSCDTPHPSSIEVWVKGEHIQTFEIPDAPRDYRGVLSTINQSAPDFSYGYFHKIRIPKSISHKAEKFEVTLKTAEGTNGGLQIFGSRSGAYLTNPTIYTCQ